MGGGSVRRDEDLSVPKGEGLWVQIPTVDGFRDPGGRKLP